MHGALVPRPCLAPQNRDRAVYDNGETHRAPDIVSDRRPDTETRRIVHVDMDAFYAAIEQRDFPDRYAGEPIAVGGTPPRGVVQTASYEARPHGVHSAQPAVEAERKCPNLIFVAPRMDVYEEESKRVRSVLHRYTDLVEPLSLDEAYLDVTDPKQGPRSGTLLARRIREDIYEETGLTASAGVGPNKFVAKMASDMDKPDGLTVVPPSEQKAFIASLPIEDVHGIGPVTADTMQELGIKTGADLQNTPERTLRHHFGKRGSHFKKLAMGNDDRPVRPDRERKSVGAERTFGEDIREPSTMLDRLEPIADRVAERLQQTDHRGRTVTLKLKTHNHEVSTRQITLDRPIDRKDDLMTLAERLLERPHPPDEPIRLLGISVSSFVGQSNGGRQLVLDFKSR